MRKEFCTMLCSKCGKTMKNVLHYELGREYQFNLCTFCKYESKKKRIHYDNLHEAQQNKKGAKHG